jgi:Lrp/AsnC family leucine-responsive transcriptional regulator
LAQTIASARERLRLQARSRRRPSTVLEVRIRSGVDVFPAECEKVGLSANAAADRVRRLRRAGIITGFTAQIDPAAGGRQIEALVSVVLLPGTDSDTFATLDAR